MPSSLYEFAFDEVKRALTRQEASLDHLRTRATALVSVAAIVFGLTARSERRWAVVAVALTVMVIGAVTIAILWPRDWRFANNINDLVAEGDETAIDKHEDFLPRVQRDWALWMQKDRADNQSKLDVLYRVYAGGCALLVTEVVLAAVALA